MKIFQFTGIALAVITCLSSCSVSKCRYSSGWRLQGHGRGLAKDRPESVYVKHRIAGSATAGGVVLSDSNTWSATDAMPADTIVDTKTKPVRFSLRPVPKPGFGTQRTVKARHRDSVRLQVPGLQERSADVQLPEAAAFQQAKALSLVKTKDGYLDVMVQLLGALLLAALLSTLLGGLLFYVLLVLLEGTLALDIILIVLALAGLLLL